MEKTPQEVLELMPDALIIMALINMPRLQAGLGAEVQRLETAVRDSRRLDNPGSLKSYEFLRAQYQQQLEALQAVKDEEIRAVLDVRRRSLFEGGLLSLEVLINTSAVQAMADGIDIGESFDKVGASPVGNVLYRRS